MRSKLLFLTMLILAFTISPRAQQSQCPTCPPYSTNARWINGGSMGGYALTAGSGLTLNVSAGTSFCANTRITYAGGTLTMTNNTTNYVYLNVASSCVPASNTSGYTASTIPLGTVVTSAGNITSITIDATAFKANSNNTTAVTTTGSPANGNLTKFTGPTTISNGDLTGDCATSGTLSVTCTKINGGTVPTSAALLGTNGSAQPVAATAHDASTVLKCVAASASGSAYTCSTTPTFTPAANDSVMLQADVANTGSATLNVNSSAAHTIKKQGGSTNLLANDLLANTWSLMTYDGTNWQMQGQVGNSASGVSSINCDGTLFTCSTTGAVTLTPVLQNPNTIFAGPISSSLANLVQYNSGSVGSSTGSGLSVPYLSSVGLHHLLVAVIASNGTPFTLTSSNNSWNLAISGSFGLNDYVYYTCDSASGADTVLAGTPTTAITLMQIYEFSGNDHTTATSCLDLATHAQQTAGTAFTITSGGSVAQATELVMSFGVPNQGASNPTVTLASPYLLPQAAAQVTTPIFAELVTAVNGNSTGLSGVQSVTYNASVAPGFWTGEIFSFKLSTTGTAAASFKNITLDFLPSGSTRTIASGTVALGTSAISSGACGTASTSGASGAATTDNVMADFNADPTSTTGYQAGAMLTIIKWVTANTVNFKQCNNTGSSITPGAVTLNWRVVR
jgi:hypothetical protein